MFINVLVNVLIYYFEKPRKVLPWNGTKRVCAGLIARTALICSANRVFNSLQTPHFQTEATKINYRSIGVNSRAGTQLFLFAAFEFFLSN